MNKTIKTTALVCAALFAVTACSSGGSSGPETNPTPSTPSKPNTPSKPATPANPAVPSNPATPSKPATPATPSASVGGAALSVKAGQLAITKFTTVVGDMKTSITVDGHKIDLSKANEASTFYNFLGNDDLNARHTTISGKKYSHVRFGHEYWVSPTLPEGNRDTHFAVGNITPISGVDAMPTSGKATYVGDSVLGWDVLDAKFNVDFGSKTITGVINNEAKSLYERVPLKGTISGASFSGDENGISMKGNFYGPKAAELGGVFRFERNNGTGFSGAFGAKKQ
ncbi:transferrin-binding protein-like solute binding protein [uncultured Neisseria sp.]|uniref:transferrin-binding protein-like solute binding protein n=1 Tax=uncultured Neisseria sp. TaxID=237778 RepID=UPI002611106C|nr:transferrin-binding protein-like solute binding protein [uncultured Neisseria sp.]